MKTDIQNKRCTTCKRIIWLGILAALISFSPSRTYAQQRVIVSTNQHNQHNQQIQLLQVQITNMERYIVGIELNYKFTWFSRDGLRQYRAWIYNLRLQQAQLRWQLHQLMFSRR